MFYQFCSAKVTKIVEKRSAVFQIDSFRIVYFFHRSEMMFNGDGSSRYIASSQKRRLLYDWQIPKECKLTLNLLKNFVYNFSLVHHPSNAALPSDAIVHVVIIFSYYEVHSSMFDSFF